MEFLIRKAKTIECITYNILGQGSQSQRYLLTAIPKTHTCKFGCGGRHRLDAIFKILVWSFIVMMKGFFPDSRHDDTPFGEKDKQRKKLNGPLDFWAALLQVRGDWSSLKQVFGLPSWSSTQICWRCSAGTDEYPYTECGKKAGWRKTRCPKHSSNGRGQKECSPVSSSTAQASLF